MTGLRLVLVVLLLQVAFYGKANAESWKRTDKNAKIIAKASLQLEKSILKTKSNDDMDNVAKIDAVNEQALDTEIQLQEALEVVLYWAYKSPDQERYMKRVAKNVTASQLEKLKSILKTLKHHESWMTDEYAIDYIEKHAERWAKSDVLLAQENLRKKTQNVAQNR